MRILFCIYLTGQDINSMIDSDLSSLGRLFMVGLPGTTLDASTLVLISDYGINNFIIFSRNVSSKQQLSQLCSDLRQACLWNGLPAPLISIDQEGGSVARLPQPFSQFPDARVLAESENPEKEIENFARICGRELAEMGINMNLAPVLDVCETGQGFFMERRSLGHDPIKTAKLGCMIINELQKKGIAACGKHFPGLGAAIVDPHLELPLVNSSLEKLHTIDIIPFKAAIDAGVAAIMTSHTIYQSLDPETPATMSVVILNNMLRVELGYKGPIITDDLEMGAIEKEGPLQDAALSALKAGADILLICHDHSKVLKAYARIASAIKVDADLALKLKSSYRRVEDLQKRFTH